MVAGTILGSATTGTAVNFNSGSNAENSNIPTNTSDFMPSVISFNSVGTTATVLLTNDGSTTYLPMSGLELVAVPEPATFGLLGLAFGGLMMARRRRK